MSAVCLVVQCLSPHGEWVSGFLQEHINHVLMACHAQSTISAMLYCFVWGLRTGRKVKYFQRMIGWIQDEDPTDRAKMLINLLHTFYVGKIQLQQKHSDVQTSAVSTVRASAPVLFALVKLLQVW